MLKPLQLVISLAQLRNYHRTPSQE